MLFIIELMNITKTMIGIEITNTENKKDQFMGHIMKKIVIEEML